MTRRRQHSGFTLIEVMVSLIIIGVGMLGIAKIQALAYASTGTASLRSLAALEASSLAAAMRANRNYWSVTAATVSQTITITGANVTASTDPLLLIAYNCALGGGNAPCTAPQLAAYDVQQWAANLNPLLPSATATIFCEAPVPAGYPLGSPIDCTVQLNWAERTVGINVQSDGNAMLAPTYTLYVEP
jgi:type IV pilus assembly protein PilV